MNDDHYAELRAALERLPANDSNNVWADMYHIRAATCPDDVYKIASVIIAARRLVEAMEWQEIESMTPTNEELKQLVVQPPQEWLDEGTEQ